MNRKSIILWSMASWVLLLYPLRRTLTALNESSWFWTGLVVSVLSSAVGTSLVASRQCQLVYFTACRLCFQHSTKRLGSLFEPTSRTSRV